MISARGTSVLRPILRVLMSPAEIMSACVLILAAGAVRIVGHDSRVGIHRPYFDQVLFAGLDRSQAKAKYDALSQSVAAYLAKMGMSDRLHQDMMKVPSNESRLLSYDDMKAFNLSGEDALQNMAKPK